MSTATLPPPPRTLTFAQIAEHTLGMSVTWQELLTLLVHPSAKVIVNFEIIRDGERSAGGVEVSREIMLERARNGMRWAEEKGERQLVNVNATPNGVLWIG